MEQREGGFYPLHKSSIGSAREGFDEMDEDSGASSAELRDDGCIQFEFVYCSGDNAVDKAKRGASSTGCKARAKPRPHFGDRVALDPRLPMH